jgi:hypothetical protein
MQAMNPSNAESVFELLQRLIPHTEVLKHAQGKLILGIKMSALSVIKGVDLEALVKSIPGILETKMKLLSRSVAVTYDPEILPYDLMDSIFHLKENPDQKTQVLNHLVRVMDG